MLCASPNTPVPGPRSPGPGPVFDWKLSEALTLTLFPDILAYYAFIYVIVIIGLATHVCAPLRVALHRRPPWAKGWCLGEVCVRRDDGAARQNRSRLVTTTV